MWSTSNRGMGGDQGHGDTQMQPVAVHPPLSPRIEAAVTQTLTREGVEAYFTMISKIRRLDSDMDTFEDRLPVLDSIRGCPTCFQLDGFHDNAPHASARAAIPARLTWKPGEVPVYRRDR